MNKICADNSDLFIGGISPKGEIPLDIYLDKNKTVRYTYKVRFRFLREALYEKGS